MSTWSYVVGTASLVLAIIYPSWKTLEAIESRSKEDDRQWLSYWLVFSFLFALKSILMPILRWVPLFGEFQCLIFAWLVLPQFQGATYVHDALIYPALLRTKKRLEKVPAFRKMFKAKYYALDGTGNAERINHPNAEVDELVERVRRMLESKWSKVHATKEGTVFDRKVAEKDYNKAVDRVSKMVQKHGEEGGVKISASHAHPMRLGAKFTGKKQNGNGDSEEGATVSE